MKVTSDGVEYEIRVRLNHVPKTTQHLYVIRAWLITKEGECGLTDESPPFLIDDYHSIYEEYLAKIVKDKLLEISKI